jgi:hypothetical protein
VALEENVNSYFMHWALGKSTPYGAISKSPIRSHGLEIKVNDESGFPVVAGEIIHTSADPRFLNHVLGLYRNASQFGFSDFPAPVFPMTPYSSLLVENNENFEAPALYIFERRRIHAGLILTADQLARASSVNSQVIPGAIWGACDFGKNGAANNPAASLCK